MFKKLLKQIKRKRISKRNNKKFNIKDFYQTQKDSFTKVFKKNEEKDEILGNMIEDVIKNKFELSGFHITRVSIN